VPAEIYHLDHEMTDWKEDSDGVAVRFANGTTHRADLLVCADGVASTARARLLPGVLGDEASAEQDSFANGLLDYPHYTRPEEIHGRRVPEVLLSGDHARIARWRMMQALGRSATRRPDLLGKAQLDDEQKRLLQEFLSDATHPRDVR